jgi:hypothetical protein
VTAETSSPASLEDRARIWIEPYWNAEHLRRALDWLLELEPGAGEALRLAALTHDMERHFPGGPVPDLSIPPADDTAYREAHSERSAGIVARWLRENGAAEDVVEEAERLIVLHEVGGGATADLLQAADSISFLEVNLDVPYAWLRAGRCDLARARAQHDWMFGRIRVSRAVDLARPFHERAIAAGEASE